MATIVKLELVSGIQVGPNSTVLPDGTIVDPVPYEAADVTLDDGTVIQIERPLTMASINAEIAKDTRSPVTIDAVTEGDSTLAPVGAIEPSESSLGATGFELVAKHRYRQGLIGWPWFRCQECGLGRQADIHIKTLAPLFHEVQNMARRLDTSERTVMTASELTTAIAGICLEYGTDYEWMDRPVDANYLACGKETFIRLVTDHYFCPFPKQQLDYQDCDDVTDFVKAWGALVGVTAQVKVYDYGSIEKHVYNLFIHTDGVSFFDGGTTHWAQPPEGTKYSFRRDVKLHV